MTTISPALTPFATASDVPYLSLAGISKSFPGGAGVEPTDLAIREGEMLVLLGPSGCGKTTLLNMIAGLLEPDSGSVTVDGKDLTKVPTHRREISMVFQTWALFPGMTVEQNVAFGLRMRKVPKPERNRRVAEALELVQLGALAGRKPGQLSGGQQQRVALARAVVTRPKVLLLDEPLSSLDHQIRVGLRRELRRLQRELGLTGVYVTHDHSEALALGDRIAVMREGKVVEFGEPREVFASPRRRYTAEFLSVGTMIDIVDVDAGTATTSLGTQRSIAADIVALCVRPTSVRLEPTAVPNPVPDVDGFSYHDAEIVGIEYEPAGVSYSFLLDGGQLIVGFSSELSPQTIGHRSVVSVQWNDVISLTA